MQPSLARVLVAVDGSTDAYKAFESALDLAKKLSSTVYVLQVIEMPSTLGIKKELILDLKMQFEIEARRLLAEYAYLAQSKYGIEVETIFRSGYPPRVILDVAKEKSWAERHQRSLSGQCFAFDRTGIKGTGSCRKIMEFEIQSCRQMRAKKQVL